VVRRLIARLCLLACRRFGALFLVGAAGLSASPPGPGSLPTITSSAQFYGAPLDQLRQGCPIRIEAVLLYGDIPWRMLFLKDVSGPLYIDLPPVGAWPEIESGDWLLLEGKSAVSGMDRTIQDPRLQVLGRGKMPEAISLDAIGLLDPNMQANYVRVYGVVREMS
jgi:hypothetical protein